MSETNPSPNSTESTKELSPEEVTTFWENLRANPELYFQKLLKIKTKQRTLSPLTLNQEQRVVLKEVLRQRKANKPVRVVVLKSRQVGMSTLTAALTFYWTVLFPNTSAKVIAHDYAATENLFRMYHLFYDELPEELKPPKKFSGKKELVFEAPLRSQISIATAGKGTAGRSETINVLHASELAYWEDAAEVMTGLLPSIPHTPDSMVIYESTAQSFGDYFHEIYNDAKDGKNEFVPVFLPWYNFAEYADELSDAEARYIEADLDEEERLLRRKHKLTTGQLKFRRRIIELFAGKQSILSPEDRFKRDYPSNDFEAFLVSGRLAFDPNALMRITPKEPLKKLRLTDLTDFKYKGPQVARMQAHPHGELHVWGEPQQGAQYLIGGDVALGNRGEDFSVLQVINKRTLEQVAEWHGRIDPDVFGRIAVRLASWYNEALIAVENNSMGLATNIAIRDTYYPNVYTRKTYKSNIDRPVDEFGWNTNVQTKPVVVAEMGRHIREGTLTVNSAGLLRECLAFRQNEKGQFEAQEGEHDDRVISMAIALQVLTEHPYVNKRGNEETLTKLIADEEEGIEFLETEPAFDSEIGEIV